MTTVISPKRTKPVEHSLSCVTIILLSFVSVCVHCVHSRFQPLVPFMTLGICMFMAFLHIWRCCRASKDFRKKGSGLDNSASTL